MNKTKGILGIDAGGTFTDLIFLPGDRTAVGACVKVQTRHDDLLSTIEEGIALILKQVDGHLIGDVHLASTLATNATVENKMAPAGLLLIGYEERDILQAKEKNLFGSASTEIASVVGGHDEKGNERMPLDEEGVAAALDWFLQKGVEGIAISGYFSVRNPTHEITARDLIRRHKPGMSVTCGHELASELDAFKRATTAAINAGLIPIVMKLLKAVKSVLAKLGVDAPLSVVRGDGSLVSADWAESHPVETVVSGPSASAMGARFLAAAGETGRASWVVDIGGTTTDIIRLDEVGNPSVKNDGADIGGHKILIKTIDIRTFGLGGDSRVVRQRDGKLQIGPRRVVPLAAAVVAFPGTDELLDELERGKPSGREPLIILPGRDTPPENALEERVASKLRDGHSTLERLGEGESIGVAHSMGQLVDKLDERGLVKIAAFTPTDALVALNKLDRWESGASLIGARILASHPARPVGEEGFCREVCEAVSKRIAREIFVKALDNVGYSGAADGADLLELGLRRTTAGPDVSLRLNGNVIGVGAPAWAFMPEAAAMLGESAIQPGNSAVAGAVGAAVGTFFLHHTLLITPLLATGGFRVHLPDGIRDFGELEEAVSVSVEFMIPWLKDLATLAGGAFPEIEWTRRDEIARVSGGTRSIHLWTQILFSVRDGAD
jgi:N-methylhydantoinase A/oxoprolinase/acetone carboxylase beta subunit